jgi:hypothetical protein
MISKHRGKTLESGQYTGFVDFSIILKAKPGDQYKPYHSAISPLLNSNDEINPDG